MKRWMAGKVVRCKDDVTLTCGGPKDDLACRSLGILNGRDIVELE